LAGLVFTRLPQPNVHDWETFIKPAELDAMMWSCSLINRDRQGIGPKNRHLPAMLSILRSIKKAEYLTRNWPAN
jgi:hypothetical protein